MLDRVVRYLKPYAQFQFENLDAWVAARNAIGVLLALLVGNYFASPGDTLFLGTAALIVCYSDYPDSYLRRAKRLTAATLLCAVAGFAGVWLGSQGLGALLFLSAWAFAAGLSVVLGPTAADLSLFSFVMLVIVAGRPSPLPVAVHAGCLALAGGFIQTALALVLWPLRRYRPERRELANLYADLGRVFSSPLRSAKAPLVSSEITRAQQLLSGLKLDVSPRGERYRSLLNQAERVRLSLVSLLRLQSQWQREPMAAEPLSNLERFLLDSAMILEAISETLRTGRDETDLPLFLKRLEGRLAEMVPSAHQALSAWAREIFFQMEALAGQLRSASRLATQLTQKGAREQSLREAKQPWSLRFDGVAATLRANLTLRSVGFRHAVRLSASILIGLLVGHSLGLYRAYWLPMTIALVLRPDFAGTLNRGLLRIAGTVVGLILTTILFHVLAPGPAGDIALIALSVFLLRWIGPANYGLFTMLVSALIVSLFAVAGVEPRELIWYRGLNTVLGGTIALLFYRIWPTWEATQVLEVMARMLDCYRTYFQLVAGALAGAPPDVASIDAARLDSRVARINLLASVERVEAEPARGAAENLPILKASLATTHRFIHAVMSLDASGEGYFRLSPEAREVLGRLAEDVTRTLAVLASLLRGRGEGAGALPYLRGDYRDLMASPGERPLWLEGEIDRLINSLNTLSEQVGRLKSP